LADQEVAEALQVGLPQVEEGVEHCQSRAEAAGEVRLRVVVAAAAL